MTTTEVFQSGDGQAVRLPDGFQFVGSQVAIRKEGESVILEPIKNGAWPQGFFEAIRISDPAFCRPDQGPMPAVPKIDPA